jgi:hypothetical protein
MRKICDKGFAMDVSCLSGIKEEDVTGLDFQVLELAIRAPLDTPLDAEQCCVIAMAKSGNGQRLPNQGRRFGNGDLSRGFVFRVKTTDITSDKTKR